MNGIADGKEGWPLNTGSDSVRKGLCYQELLHPHTDPEKDEINRC